MPAPCSHCGGTVMPYRRYFFHSRPTAICDTCGRRVRLRHFWGLVSLSVVGFAVLLAGSLLLDSIAAFGGLVVVLAAVFLVLDRWSWGAVPWDPVDQGAATETG